MKLDVLPSRTGDDPWYAGGLRFTCTQCGNCCTGGPGYVWITREEILRLAEYLRLTPEQIVERYCRTIDGRFSLREVRNRGLYDCIFLKEETSPAAGDGGAAGARRVCSVYPVRPRQCRTWPFWPENLASRQNWNRAARNCPGMNSGRHYPRRDVEAIRDSQPPD